MTTDKRNLTVPQQLALLVTLLAFAAVWLGPFDTWPLRAIVSPFTILTVLYIWMTRSKTLGKYSSRLAYGILLGLAALVLWLSVISGLRSAAVLPWVVGSLMIATYAITGIVSNQPLRNRSLGWKIVGLGPIAIGSIAVVLYIAFFIYVMSHFEF